MQYENPKNYYNRGRNMRAPLPNVENLIKDIKSNPKYQQYQRQAQSQSRPYIKKSNSSLSNRSDSRGSYNDSDKYYSNENSVSDILPTNDTSKDSSRNNNVPAKK
jgi:hypothetical protein